MLNLTLAKINHNKTCNLFSWNGAYKGTRKCESVSYLLHGEVSEDTDKTLLLAENESKIQSRYRKGLYLLGL